MDCGTSMVKYILFLFNTLCSICGLLLVIFGALLFNNLGQYHNIEEAVKTHQIPIVLIVLGSVVLLISFLGCCGAIRESYCMSMTYSVLLLILLIIQLVCVVYVWVDKDNYVKSMGKVVDKAWEERGSDASFMNALQVGFKCCGVSGPQDYVLVLSTPPSSCCPNSECSLTNFYVKGCKSAFTDFWAGNSDIIKFAGLAIVGIELIGFIFGCCLANNIRNYKRRAAY